MEKYNKRIVFLLLMLSMNSKVTSQNIGELGKQECDLLNLIITNDKISKIFQSNEIEETDTGLRIFDLTGKFKYCTSNVAKFKNGFLQYYVFKELLPGVNTGKFRDITIKKFKKNKKRELEIDIIACSFKTFYNSNPCSVFRLTIQVESDKFIIKNVESAAYYDPHPEPFYYKN